MFPTASNPLEVLFAAGAEMASDSIELDTLD
jgi:hypothetical protein